MTPDELAEMLKMPEPDTHCWDDDIKRDVWSYSAEQMRAYALAHIVAERERCANINRARAMKIEREAQRAASVGEHYEAHILRATAWQLTVTEYEIRSPQK